MKKNKTQKGITLVALIITIIVLLILAVVAIRAVQGDGIISKAKDAAKQTNIAQEKEEVQMAVLEWQLANKNGAPTLEAFLSEKYGVDKVQLNTDKSITVTMPSENRYKVTTSGEAILLDGTVEKPTPIVPEIILDKTSITKEIESGATATDTITATLNNANGELTWSSSDSSVAEISGEGNTRTITLKKAGTARITVSYGTISSTCVINVTEIEMVTVTYIVSGYGLSRIITFTEQDGNVYAESMSSYELKVPKDTKLKNILTENINANMVDSDFPMKSSEFEGNDRWSSIRTYGLPCVAFVTDLPAFKIDGVDVRK